MRVKQSLAAVVIAVLGLFAPGSAGAEVTGPAITGFSCDYFFGEVDCGGTITGDGPFTYTWYRNEVLLPNQHGPSILIGCVPPSGPTFTLVVTDVNGGQAAASAGAACTRGREL